MSVKLNEYHELQMSENSLSGIFKHKKYNISEEF